MQSLGKKRQSSVWNSESVFWGVSLFAVSALFYFYDVPNKGVTSASAQTPIVYPSASPQPSTKFSSAAACESARYVGVSPKNSGAISNPCPGLGDYYVWGTSVFVTRDCVQTAVGVWTLYLASKTTTTRKVFSSSGPNQAGITQCSATPYVSSEKTEFLVWDAAAGFFRANFYVDTNTPIIANYNQSWINAYGIPKFWKDTTVATTGNTSGMTSPPQVVQGQVGVTEWEF